MSDLLNKACQIIIDNVPDHWKDILLKSQAYGIIETNTLISQLESQYPGNLKEQCRCFLTAWQQKVDQEATVENLCDILSNANLNKVKSDIEKECHITPRENVRKQSIPFPLESEDAGVSNMESIPEADQEGRRRSLSETSPFEKDRQQRKASHVGCSPSNPEFNIHQVKSEPYLHDNDMVTDDFQKYLQQEMSHLKLKGQRLKSTIELKEKDIAHLKEEKSTLLTENNSLKSKVEKLERKNKDLVKRENAQVEKLERCKSKIALKEKDIAHLKEDNSTLQKQNSSLKSTVKKLKGKNEDFVTRENELKTCLSNKKTECSLLKEKLCNATIANAANESRFSNQIKKQKESNKYLVDEVSRLNNAHKKAKELIKHQNIEHKQHEEQHYEEIKSKNEEHEKQIRSQHKKEITRLENLHKDDRFEWKGKISRCNRDMFILCSICILLFVSVLAGILVILS